MGPPPTPIGIHISTGILSGPASRLLFEQGAACMISSFHIHGLHDLAQNCSSGGDLESRVICFFNHPLLHKVATKREWLELRAAGTRSKFSFDAGLLGVRSSYGEIAATTICNLDDALMGVKEIRHRRIDDC